MVQVALPWQPAGRRHRATLWSAAAMSAHAPSSLEGEQQPADLVPVSEHPGCSSDRRRTRSPQRQTQCGLHGRDFGPGGLSARLDRLFAAKRLGELVPVVEVATATDPLESGDRRQFGGQPGELSESRPPGRLTAVVVGGVAAVVLLIAILLVLLISQ